MPMSTTDGTLLVCLCAIVVSLPWLFNYWTVCSIFLLVCAFYSLLKELVSTDGSVPVEENRSQCLDDGPELPGSKYKPFLPSLPEESPVKLLKASEDISFGPFHFPTDPLIPLRTQPDETTESSPEDTQQQVCRQCGVVMDKADGSLCPACTAPMPSLTPLTCTNCKMNYPSGAMFCSYCGRSREHNKMASMQFPPTTIHEHSETDG